MSIKKYNHHWLLCLLVLVSSKKPFNNNKIHIIGLDTLNDYYDVNLKKDRLKILKKIKILNLKNRY